MTDVGRQPLDGLLEATPEPWHAGEDQAPIFAEAEEAQVRDRLEGLGYL